MKAHRSRPPPPPRHLPRPPSRCWANPQPLPFLPSALAREGTGGEGGLPLDRVCQFGVGLLHQSVRIADLAPPGLQPGGLLHLPWRRVLAFPFKVDGEIEREREREREEFTLVRFGPCGMRSISHGIEGRGSFYARGSNGRMYVMCVRSVCVCLRSYVYVYMCINI